MKLTLDRLAQIIDYTGLIHNEAVDYAGFPADDYYETDELNGGCNVVLKDVSEFGQSFGVGVYCKPDSDRDIGEALVAAERDLFPNVFLFVDRKPKLKLVG